MDGESLPRFMPGHQKPNGLAFDGDMPVPCHIHLNHRPPMHPAPTYTCTGLGFKLMVVVWVMIALVVHTRSACRVGDF